MCTWAGQIGQQVKALTAKYDHLNAVLATHMVEGES